MGRVGEWQGVQPQIYIVARTAASEISMASAYVWRVYSGKKYPLVLEIGGICRSGEPSELSGLVGCLDSIAKMLLEDVVYTSELQCYHLW